MQCYNFHYLEHIVHFYRTCYYSHMLRMALAYGEFLLTVSTEILFQWTNIVAWEQMSTFCGIAANLQDTLVGWFSVLFSLFFPSSPESAGMVGG
uniref:Uncharacterized protein n=1 Tax=Theropithecus gelada TaxID=9565 RepID=A0A8D2JXP6_THEGE